MRLSIFILSLSFLVLIVSSKQQMKVVGIQDAWKRYPSASLVSDSFELQMPTREEMKKLNDRDIKEIISIKMEYLSNEVTRMSEIYSNDIYLFSMLGQIYVSHMIYDKALQCFNRVLKLSKNKGHAYMNLANLYYIQNNTDKAMFNYKEALKHSRNDPVILLNLSFLEYETGMFKEAKLHYLIAVVIDPTLDRKEYNVIASVNIQDDDGTKADYKGNKTKPVIWFEGY